MALFGSLMGAVPPPGTSAHKAYMRSTGVTSAQAAANYAAQQAIPPDGSSAQKAMLYSQRAGSPPPSLANVLTGSSSSARSSRRSVPVASAPSAQSLDYLNADLAKYYGMSKETAYSEALSNTAYQRAVKDMQAAGLNPAVLFGAGRASTADGVNYPQSASGGSGGSERRYSGGSGKGAYLFSEGAYGAISAAAGLVGMTMTKNPTGFWIGSQTAKGIMGALNSLTR